ncbi:HAMP domain-containing sensor histidine kinase [Nocardioides sp.]|uniref:sensor histidine kinase n=1 Tax=Nocardioides sp. TaxID=35761 RepID=UPI002B855BB1|nr:HAMP domain-containing sensor histidine kinase [Nocardioides sp.]HXH79051.1 HAMP domain-containing sensor histidine kinase [Nocardioides sp.]
MQLSTMNKFMGGWQEGLLAAALTTVPAGVLWASLPGDQGSAAAGLAAGVVAGALLLMATLSFHLRGLASPGTNRGWIPVAMVLLASQLTVSSGLRLVEMDSWNGTAWWLTLVDLSVTAAALFLVMRQERALPRWVRRRLMAVVCLIGAVHVTRVGGLDAWASDLAAVVALAAATALWTSATSLILRETLHNEHQRSAGLEDSLLELESTWRGTREQLHEIRGTLAGVSRASGLLSDPTLDADTRAGMEVSIRTELDRLERLVSGRAPAAPEPVDVDATLDVLLTSHRARGRAIDWEPNGAAVQGRPDDVAEALNILIDNAAVHGGTVSRIDVTQGDDLVEIAVSDAGPGVPFESRERIFDWGVRGNQSLGDGIGLNLARRLISEQGGSLRLAEPGTRGASFVIRLPAARRSEENDVVDS